MNTKKITLALIILFVLADASHYVSGTGLSDTYLTPLSSLSKYLALFIIIYITTKSKLQEGIPKSIVNTYRILLCWNVFTIIYGAFTVRSYWDWKVLFLSSSLFLLVPLAFFIGKNLMLLRQTFFFFIKYVCYYGFLLIPIGLVTNEELYARIVIPISFFIVCLPYLKFKHQALILLVAITSVLSILDFRANIIKISVSFLALGTFYLRSLSSKILYRSAHAFMFILPTFLLLMAVFGGFNIFEQLQKNEGYTIRTKISETSNLTADTRTFLYVEVFQTMNDNGTWLFGGGAVAKYKSIYFTELVTGNMRYGTEVGFLNTLLNSGLIGVLLYFLMLLISSYYAIYKSNNNFCKMLGVLIASRWILFFLEELTQFDLNYYFLWLIIGLVSTNKFRSFTDKDLNSFFKFGAILAKPKKVSLPVS